ncbi:MAG: hypothetical protein ACM3MF_09285 [Anaerolineae bacterium]
MTRRLAIVLIVLGLIAVACTPSAAGTDPQPPTASPVPDVPTEFVPTPLPVTPTYEGCAFVWASHDLPVLSRELNASLQKISPDLTGMAYAYGEDCVYGDGHSTFSAMETDFRIGVRIKNIRDENALGDYIYKVMQVILAIPQDELVGPQSGRVDFDFKQPDPAELFVTVPIDKYRREADDLRGAELLHLFYTP